MLLTILIPLLIHLFNKQRKKRIQFSSIFFLKMLEKQRLKRLKLYQYLLILIRTILLLFLVLAFARPALTSRDSFLGKKASTTAVIVIDNCINMLRYDNSGQRFKRAKDKLNAVLNEFNSEDDVFVLTTHKPDKILTDIGSIHNLQCFYGNSKWLESLTHSIKLFDEHPNINKELIIISDFQFTNKNFEQILPQIPDVSIYLFQINSGEIINVSIDSLVIVNKIFEINKTIKLNVFVRNSSQDLVRDIELHLFIDDKRVAHQTFDLESQEKKVIPLSFQSKKYGKHQGYIEISDDDLMADNRFFFTIDIPAEINVLFVDDTPSSYILSAFSSINANSNINITTEHYSSWARQSFNDYNIIFISNPTILTAILLDRIKIFMDQGGTLIFMPGEETTINDLNKLLHKLRFDIDFRRLISSSSAEEYYTIKKPDIQHPMFEGLFVQEPVSFSQPKFFKYYEIAPRFAGEAVLSLNNNAPFLIYSHNQNGSLYILASYIDTDWSDLQYKGIFLPLLLRLFYFAAINLNTNFDSSPDDEIIYTLDKEIGQGEYHIVHAEGELQKIVPEPIGSKSVFIIDQLNQPGNYTLMSGKDNVATFSINVDTRSLLSSTKDLKIHLSNNENITIFEEQENIEKILQLARYGQEIWQHLVILTLLISVIELIIIKKIEGRSS